MNETSTRFGIALIADNKSGGRVYIFGGRFVTITMLFSELAFPNTSPK